MRRMARLLTAAAVILAGVALAEDLNLGDYAPKLAVKEFVKGDPVTEFEKGKIYVVEFWATWCGPCIVSIPHLSEMQKEHKNVAFIGVSVWERDQSKVKPFVEKMGEKMDYRVAMDLIPEPPKTKDGDDADKKPVRPAEGEMARTWLKAAGQNGIPSAFIVDGDGKIAWIGHPMSGMDKVLKKVESGAWNILAEAEKAKKLKAVMADLNRVFRGKDSKAKLELIEKALAIDPEMESRFGVAKFQTMLESEESGDREKAIAYGLHLVEKVFIDSADSQQLNALAWAIVDPDSKLKFDKSAKEFALKSAEMADKLAKGADAAIADTLAKALYDCGRFDKALSAQQRAVKLAKGTPLERDESLKERLKQYEKAAAEKKVAN